MARRSRLSRYKKKQKKRKAAIYLLLSAAFIYGMVRWGVPGVINVISWWTNSGELVSQEGYQVPPQKPQLNSVPEATFSAQVDLSGTAILAKSIELYVNGDRRDQMKVEEGSNFSFKGVGLDKGSNSLEVISKNEVGESQPARVQVVRDEEKPSISIEQPGLEAEKYGPEEDEIKIVGSVNEEAEVLINEHLVFVDNQSKFEFESSLKEGMNEFVVKATDKAGNQAEKLVRVSYSR